MSASFCWHCGQTLAPSFATLTDPLIGTVRVHLSCEDAARRSLHPHTARETELMPRYLFTEDPR